MFVKYKRQGHMVATIERTMYIRTHAGATLLCHSCHLTRSQDYSRYFRLQN